MSCRVSSQIQGNECDIKSGSTGGETTSVSSSLSLRLSQAGGAEGGKKGRRNSCRVGALRGSHTAKESIFGSPRLISGLGGLQGEKQMLCKHARVCSFSLEEKKPCNTKGLLGLLLSQRLPQQSETFDGRARRAGGTRAGQPMRRRGWQGCLGRCMAAWQLASTRVFDPVVLLRQDSPCIVYRVSPKLWRGRWFFPKRGVH